MGNIFNYAMGGIVDFLEVYIIFRYMMIFFEDAYVNDRLAYIPMQHAFLFLLPCVLLPYLQLLVPEFHTGVFFLFRFVM